MAKQKNKEEFKAMYTKLDLLKMDARREGMTQGILQGISQGISQGVSQGVSQTARAMLCDKMDINLVARYTSLPIEEVKKLNASL